jgi:hypothetical protein
MDYQYRPCLVCGKPGIEKCSEKLPDGAVLIKVFHNDQEFCAFPEYKSVDSFLHRRKGGTIINHCPVCRKSGRVFSYRRNKSQKNFKWSFYVAHEHLQGYWGKKTKIRKVRRCYMNTEDRENVIKKELGMI